MSLENFWEMFAKTGDIEYYLLYKKSVGTLRSRDNNRREKAECVQ